MLNVTITDGTGLPLTCETDGCGRLASAVWSGGWDGKPRRCCDEHNPMANTVAALPLNFTSQPLCHACGQPISVSTLIRT